MEPDIDQAESNSYIMSNEEMASDILLDTEESNTRTSFPDNTLNEDSANATYDRDDLQEEPEETGDSSTPFGSESQGRKRKYTRKMYDINAVRTKLPRRAKDFRLELDSDFVEVPPSPRGRGRGRKKLLPGSFVSPVAEEEEEIPAEPVSLDTPKRGRGRGRGSRGTRTSRGSRTPRTPKPRVPTFQVWEEETRTSVDNGVAFSMATPVSGFREESTNMSTQSTKKKFTREVFDANSQQPLPAIQLTEYQWPPDDLNAETWMVQEQVVAFLSIKLNFRRKYPDLKRRNVDASERNFLRDKGVVSETQADLGLTALLSREVVDLFFNDFPDKYEEYLAAQHEKKEQAYRMKPKTLTATPAVPVGEKKPYDPRLRAIKAAAKWNSMFNKERLEERPCSLDMQTLTLQVPRRPPRVMEKALNVYPAAVIPGQFSEHYHSYTPYELKCLPLNTIVRGPITGEADPTKKRGIKKRALITEANSCGSITDSDASTSSSDDSSSDSDSESHDSSSSSEEVDSEPEALIDCKVCHGNKSRKDGKRDSVIRCAQCHCDGHLSCWELNPDMLPQIRAYPWQCNDCKTCDYCRDPTDEDKILFCDYCDRGFHIYCVGLRKVPDGRWHCPSCAKCGSCGTQDPSGGEPDKQPQWIHEYKTTSTGAKAYAVTLCGVCVRLWRKGSYCGLCNRCFGEEETKLNHCIHCKQQVHEACLNKTKRSTYTCDSCLFKQRSMKKK